MAAVFSKRSILARTTRIKMNSEKGRKSIHVQDHVLYYCYWYHRYNYYHCRVCSYCCWYCCCYRHNYDWMSTQRLKIGQRRREDFFVHFPALYLTTSQRDDFGRYRDRNYSNRAVFKWLSQNQYGTEVFIYSDQSQTEETARWTNQSSYCSTCL